MRLQTISPERFTSINICITSYNFITYGQYQYRSQVGICLNRILLGSNYEHQLCNRHKNDPPKIILIHHSAYLALAATPCFGLSSSGHDLHGFEPQVVKQNEVDTFMKKMQYIKSRIARTEAGTRAACFMSMEPLLEILSWPGRTSWHRPQSIGAPRGETPWLLLTQHSDHSNHPGGRLPLACCQKRLKSSLPATIFPALPGMPMWPVDNQSLVQDWKVRPSIENSVALPSYCTPTPFFPKQNEVWRISTPILRPWSLPVGCRP